MFFFLSKDMLRARREGAVFEDLPQRDIDFAESISVLKIQEVYLLSDKPSDYLTQFHIFCAT